MSQPICKILRLGCMDFQQAWDLQNEIAAKIVRGEHPPALLLLEHPHTYTFGRRGQVQHLLWNEEQLRQRGIKVYWIDRGGDVTYHGPGQLVGYPLLPLAPFDWIKTSAAQNSSHLPQADYVGYVRRLEEVLLRTLSRLGLPSAQRVDGLTGIWIPDVPLPAKIAAIGVKVDVHGVSRHGFALNVNPDMSYWQGIVGCGLAGYPVTSLAQRMQPAPSLAQTADQVVQAFVEVFQFSV